MGKARWMARRNQDKGTGIGQVVVESQGSLAKDETGCE